MKTHVQVERPTSEFPELVVTVPDDWPHIIIAPLYDVHMGHSLHATKAFLRHLEWLKREDHVLTFNGGDMVENVVLGSPGADTQVKTPDKQIEEAGDLLRPVAHKFLFAIPGNHEARTMRVAGFDVAKTLAKEMGVKYFTDFCFCTIKWRGNNFRLAAHHGTGAAQTPGGQRNAARKDMPWLEADIYWTGHLHQPMVDLIYRVDHDQSATGASMFTRQSFSIVSPSYLQYFGGYAAAKRYAPGAIGLIRVTLREDGHMDCTLHAKGKRL